MTANVDGTIQRVKELMLEAIHVDVGSTDTDLIETGVIDSLALVELIFSLEQEFGVSIRLDEDSIENFRTVRGIAHMIVLSMSRDDYDGG